MAALCILAACTKTPLEQALIQAGKNRKELEKVLEYYQNDSLKLRAAQFLIENMPYHYSYQGKELKKYHQYFERFSVSAWRGPAFLRDSIIQQDGIFHFDSLHTITDIKTIKANYLIRNIDFAFKVWHEQPWGKYVSFHNFLEFVLPYRVGTEAITDWREEIYNRYNPMLDSIRNTPNGDNIKTVAQILMDSLHKAPIYYTGIFPQGPNVGPQLVKWRSGNCRELTDLVIYVFRALGIPCGCDKMWIRGDNNVAHFWNFIIDEKDSTYFTSIGTIKLEKAETYWNPKGKVYRETFSLNKKIIEELKSNAINVPYIFRMPTVQDVTPIYAGKNDRFLQISLDSLDVLPYKGEIVFLCASSKMKWLPIAYGYFESDTIRINHVEGDVVFRLAVCRNKKPIFLAPPFLLDRYNGNIRFFRPAQRKQQITLFQKFKEDFQNDMVNGVVEASNHPDFHWKDTLFQITERPLRLLNTAYLPTKKTYRYIRYYGPEKCYCHIAELALYGTTYDSLSLQGKLISPKGIISCDFVNQFPNVFDGNPYTSMNYYAPSGGWVGLDFGHPVQIQKITFSPRNRDNFIRKGDLYELFYAQTNGWESLGKQTATSDSLSYNAPEGALLYLRNHSRGNDERIFEMVDGKQRLW